MKEFERSTIHDLFKVLYLILCLIFSSLGLSFISISFVYIHLIQVMSKFMVAPRQAYELDHTRVRLVAKIRDIGKESSCRMGERMKLEAKVVELKILATELKTNIVEKDTCLDHLQKQNEKLRSSLSQSKDEVIREFKSSKGFTDLLDVNYAVGSEDFHMHAIESFPEMNFFAL